MVGIETYLRIGRQIHEVLPLVAALTVAASVSSNTRQCLCGSYEPPRLQAR